ncbi:MAG: hypothetical protein Q8K85_01340, partial [Hyphomicrobium sp.]|nr:hypothetical protein [Hyphomicrobium sp.]
GLIIENVRSMVIPRPLIRVLDCYWIAAPYSQGADPQQGGQKAAVDYPAPRQCGQLTKRARSNHIGAMQKGQGERRMLRAWCLPPRNDTRNP